MSRQLWISSTRIRSSPAMSEFLLFCDVVAKNHLGPGMAFLPLEAAITADQNQVEKEMPPPLGTVISNHRVLSHLPIRKKKRTEGKNSLSFCCII
jgi:hypothetical protein